MLDQTSTFGMHVPLVVSGAIAAALTALFGFGLLLFGKYIGFQRGRNGVLRRPQVQDIHVETTPRVGGLLVVLTLLLLLPVFPQRVAGAPVWAVLAASLPILLLAAFDDLIHAVSARLRLAASLFAGVLFVLVSDATVTSIRLGPIDFVLVLPLVSGVITASFFALTINAFNLIDGVNGLSASVFILIMGAIILVADNEGAHEIVQVAALFASAAFGFLVLNYPRPYFFLGDCGAYLFGFAASALVVKLYSASASMLVPHVLLLLFWPNFEVITTICRRLVARRSIFAPDKVHTHTLLFRLLRMRGLDSKSANNLAGLVCLIAAAPPTLVGALVQAPATEAWLLYGGFSALFITFRVCCRSLARSPRWRRRRRPVVVRMGIRTMPQGSGARGGHGLTEGLAASLQGHSRVGTAPLFRKVSPSATSNKPPATATGG